MENIDQVTAYIRQKNPNKITLHFYHTDEGLNYYVCGEDAFWRIINYVDSVTFNSSEDLSVIESTGKAFGRFQTQLSTFDGSVLHETIPDFHNTKKRIDTLFAHAEEDICDRVEEVAMELDYIASIRDIAVELSVQFANGEIPTRVTHSDTKCNNVLFGRTTKEPIVVIDLDTIMLGMSMYDFGDAVRFIASTAEEDEPDTSKVSFDTDKFRAFAKGFIGAARQSLEFVELNNLVKATFSITVELAARFLDDYITGDTYFRCVTPKHNLVELAVSCNLPKTSSANGINLSKLFGMLLNRFSAYRLRLCSALGGQFMKKVKQPKPTTAFVVGDAGLLRRNTCNYWEQFSLWFAIVMLALFPLFPGVRGYTNITQTKYDVFKWLTVLFVILCVLILAGLFLEKKLLRARSAGGWQKLSLPQILLMAYLLWSALSAILSDYPFIQVWMGQGRNDGLAGMLLYGALFLLLSFWGEYSDRYALSMSAMAIVLGVMMVVQIGGSTILYPENMNYYNTKFLGTIGNIDCVSGIVSTVVPVLGCAFVLLNTKWRYLCLPGYALLLYTQLFTDVDTGKMGLLAALVVVLPFLLTTRRNIVNLLVVGGVTAAVFALHSALKITGSLEEVTAAFAAGKITWLMLAAAVVLLAAAVLLYWRDKKLGGTPLPVKPKVIRIVVAAVEAAAVIAVVVFLYRYSGEHRLLAEISQMLHGELSDSAGSGRGVVWKRCITFIRETPIIGSGPGTFSARHEPFNTTQFFDFAHNDFLQIGVCQGLVGLALYVAFLVSLAVRALRVAPRCPQIVIFGGAAVGYLVYSFFVFSIAIVSPLFWVVAGIMDKMVRQVEETEKNS